MFLALAFASWRLARFNCAASITHTAEPNRWLSCLPNRHRGPNRQRQSHRESTYHDSGHNLCNTERNTKGDTDCQRDWDGVPRPASPDQSSFVCWPSLPSRCHTTSTIRMCGRRPRSTRPGHSICFEHRSNWMIISPPARTR
jgi:hypothetical protein